MLACAPELELEAGAWNCPVTHGNETGGAPSLSPPGSRTPLKLPWSTGFEDGFCGYYDGSGFCYSDSKGGFRRVTEPVHSGRFAAAFDIDAGEFRREGNQTRCVREGELPERAYYGAWYFVPSGTEELDNWNLFHFQGGKPYVIEKYWDVSLGKNDDGELFLHVFDDVDGKTYRQEPSDAVPIPIDTWFHIELYWDRSEAGEVRLYQDGKQVIHVTDPTTEYPEWGQWYVGNLANALSPSLSTVYVDDVTVRLP